MPRCSWVLSYAEKRIGINSLCNGITSVHDLPLLHDARRTPYSGVVLKKVRGADATTYDDQNDGAHALRVYAIGANIRLSRPRDRRRRLLIRKPA